MYLIESGHNGIFYSLLDLRSVKPLSFLRQFSQVQPVYVPDPLFKVDPEYLLPFLDTRKVNKEDLIVPTFPPQLRREVLWFIGSRDDEDRVLLLLKPGNKGPEDPHLGPGVSLITAYSAKGLVNLIYPEYAGAHSLCKLDAPSDILFRFPDSRPEEPSHIHPQKWKVPYPCQRLAAKGFTCPRNADEKQPFGD